MQITRLRSAGSFPHCSASGAGRAGTQCGNVLQAGDASKVLSQGGCTCRCLFIAITHRKLLPHLLVSAKSGVFPLSKLRLLCRKGAAGWEQLLQGTRRRWWSKMWLFSKDFPLSFSV